MKVMRMLLMLSVMLAGCVPSLYFAYYEPSYPDASSSLTRMFCGGHAGPRAKLTFSLPEGVKFTVAGMETLSIDISVPAAVDLRFLSDSIRVVADQTEPGVTKVAPEIAALSGKPVQRSLYLEVALGGQKSDSYLVELPPILLNGVRQQLSPITFKRRSLGVGIDPFNC